MRGIIQRGNDGAETLEVVDDLELATTNLGPRQVRVQIKAAGVCGSDLSCATGKYYMPTPMVGGHEAAGLVVEVGSAVTYCTVGDHVVMSTLNNCGHCQWCEQGEPTWCGDPGAGMAEPWTQAGEPIKQFAKVGAFAEETIVSESQAVPIPKEIPWAPASLIGCGVITGAGAVFNRAKVGLGDVCAVIGAGGVGLNVIQAAALSGARQIIAIDRVAEKEALATTFGATDFIHVGTDDFDTVAAVKSLVPGGVDHTFEVVGFTPLIPVAMNMTRPGGKIVAVGTPDLTAEATYSPLSLFQNKDLLGIRYGGARPRADFPMLADLYLRNRFKLDELVTGTDTFEGIGAAFEKIKTGKEARTVLIPG